MPSIECYSEDTVVEKDGKMVRGIIVTCGFCDKNVECAGVDSPELRQKALTLIRREDCREPYTKHVIPSDTDE